MRRTSAGAALVTLALFGASCTASTEEAENNAEPAGFVGDLPATSSAELINVESPDGLLRIEMALDQGAPVYRVVRVVEGVDRVVLGLSALGLETSLGSLGSGLRVADAGVAESWADSFVLPTGKQRAASIVGTIRTVRFEAADVDLDLEVDLLATDHGVAHRSRLIAASGTVSDDVRLDWERTSFAVPPASQAWLQTHDRNSFGRPAYEQRRSGARDVTNPIRSAEGWTFPALFETDDMWTLVTEAGLAATAAGSHLSGASTNGEFVVAQPSAFDGNGIGDVEPRGSLPFEMPWRVIVNSTDLGDIVETNLVRHLSPAGPDMAWVVPGVASWSWWSDQESPSNPEALAAFIDLAADFGWRYSLIDANWHDMDAAGFADVLAYAGERNVGLLLWYNSGGPNNSVSAGPRGLMTERHVRRAEMKRIADLGIKGIKVDFFHSDKPAGIELYLDILEDAADFELMVVFHGSTVPRGWSRTWPNLMTMEAVLGGEQYIFNLGYPVIAPAQNTVLPFTRNVVGSMDFTPMSLGERSLRRTSNAHELALSVVFESGVQHFVDTPETYQTQPAAVRDVLSDVPVAWDESQLLSGRPDDHVVMARRNGESWWVGAISGIDEARTLEFDPADLDAVGRIAILICDGEGKGDYAIEEFELTGTVELPMLDEGGCLIRID